MNKLFIIGCLSTSIVSSAIFGAAEQSGGVMHVLTSATNGVKSVAHGFAHLTTSSLRLGQTVYGEAIQSPSVVNADRALTNQIKSGQFAKLAQLGQKRIYNQGVQQVLNRHHEHSKKASRRKDHLKEFHEQYPQITFDSDSTTSLVKAINAQATSLASLAHIAATHPTQAPAELCSINIADLLQQLNELTLAVQRLNNPDISPANAVHLIPANEPAWQGNILLPDVAELLAIRLPESSSDDQKEDCNESSEEKENQ
ncbi:MAG TPA: hypothetical protein VGT41_03770 [Candidatus Babeliales bacterium]|nr:hypothetical protein [Candidatus Babeliales bacterium]